MKPKKITSKDTKRLDLETKVIYEYPRLSKDMSIARMVVKGRHPQKQNEFILESACSFVLYLTKGKGKIFAGDEVYDVKIGDAVFVPKNNKFAAEGDMEYITFDSPAFYPEQSEIIKV